MKSRILIVLALLTIQFSLFAQPDSTAGMSQGYSTERVLSTGFIIAFFLGIVVYFVIKKNPRKDAVR